MKKIITSSAILLGACLITNTASAQLASDQPSQAAQAVQAASKTAASNAAKVTEVQTASSSASTRAVVANPAKIVVTDVPATSATPVAVPSQGEEKTAPVVVASKTVEQPKMQSNSAPAKKEE